MTFTRRYLDVWPIIEYKAFCIFEDKLCIWDHGPNALDGRVLHTEDGVNWTTLFSRTAAQIGTSADHSGLGMAVYNGNLFITKYVSGAVPNPRVIEWDGANIHLHLEPPLAPQPDNKLASNLVVWDGKLWCLLDVTSGIGNDQRVVYYYDGTSWTPVTDYAGADYLNYSTGVGLPEYDIKHRTTRLFVFNDEFYLIATSWYGVGAKWSWEVWKFNATTYSNFTKIYDSDVFDDGYAFASIMEFEGKVYIVGNELAANGNGGDDGRLYASADMVNWTIEATQAGMGFPYGEVLHEGKFYLNCPNLALPRNTRIRRWEGRLSEFTLEQEITTNPLRHGGGLATFKASIYAGKYMEVYGEPGTILSQRRLKRDSLPLMEIGYKDMLGNKFTESVAPIDTRAPTRFYHGRVKQMSSLKRAVDDKTGLFQVADMSITLANADKHYSQLLASHILKNQEVTLYHAWTEEAEVLRLEVIKLIVEDHSMKGPDFTIKLKDITQKYFTMKVPENICTKDDFPDIHPDHEGRPMPEILGNASLVGDYEYEGAVEAVYVDTVGPPFRCLASAGLITIPADEVWIGTTPKTEGPLPDDYTVVQPGDGHTYIHFNAGQDPGDESVSFNAHGYSLAVWNSAAGYIQNLAYIIQYYLRYIMGIPASLVNSASFATLAGYYETMGVHLDSYLILQNREDAMETLRQLLFTGGAKGFMALDGKFNVARKNIYNWQVPEIERHIFEQIELFSSPHRKWNLTSAINTVNAQFGYIPWQNLYTGARSEYRDNLFERPMEGDIPDRWMGKPRRK